MSDGWFDGGCRSMIPILRREETIDKYLDADAVNAQLDRLIKSPIYGVLPDALAEYEREYFEKKCARSSPSSFLSNAMTVFS